MVCCSHACVYAHSGRFTRLAVIVTVVMLAVAEQQQDTPNQTTRSNDQHVCNAHETDKICTLTQAQAQAQALT